MTHNRSKLHTIVLNVRAHEDTYSAMPVRVLKAIADVDEIPVILATTNVGEDYLHLVEGDSVHVIEPARIEGLAQRAADACDVILVDVPVDPANLEASAPLIDDFRREVRSSGLRLKIFTMEKGVISQLPIASDRGLILGRGLVGIIAAHDFDIMLLRSEHRIPCVMHRPDNFMDQPDRPILTYLEDDMLAAWMQVTIDHGRRSRTIRSILDRPDRIVAGKPG